MSTGGFGDQMNGIVPRDMCVSVVQSSIGPINAIQRELPRMINSAVAQSRATWESDLIAQMRSLMAPSGAITASYDGRGHNVSHPDWGAVNSIFAVARRPVDRLAQALPNPRVVSNAVCSEARFGASAPSAAGFSDMIWIWGQFLDHDLTRTDQQQGAGAETASITTPSDDAFPNVIIPFTRSKYLLDASGDRRQQNQLSSFLDCQNIYGNSSERAYALRALDGTGKLKTSLAGNMEVMPPKNINELENNSPTGTTASDFFLCGDVRANEHVALTAIHTLFVREHNYQCDRVLEQWPELAGSDELIYQRARQIVTGIFQHITYNEFLPALLGANSAAYAQLSTAAYNANIDPMLRSEFSTVGYRVGHTLVPPALARGFSSEGYADLQLRDAFFAPAWIDANGIDQLLIGALRHTAREVDSVLTEELRSFLFGPPTMTMMHDLAAMNIQRGRDHGIPGYNDLRAAYGLPRVTSFATLPMTFAVQTALAQVYASVDDIDAWIGGIAEVHVLGSSLGPLFGAIVAEQFYRLRAGDHFFYTSTPALSDADRGYIANTLLSDVIRRNVADGSRLPSGFDAFRAQAL